MNHLTIEINSLFPNFDWKDAKIHVAQKAGQTHSIDIFTQSFSKWQNDWNGDHHSNHCWNRKYIFSIIELPNKIHQWLFGGIFQVISYEPAKNISDHQKGMIYKVDLKPHGKALIVCGKNVKNETGKKRYSSKN